MKTGFFGLRRGPFFLAACGTEQERKVYGMFIDIAKIKVKAGDGGDGAVAFHREKYVASGGPDGGDGGRGGDIVFRVDDNLSTLADFRYKRKYAAQRGENGRGKRCSGKSAPPLVITVPRGTVTVKALFFQSKTSASSVLR